MSIPYTLSSAAQDDWYNILEYTYDRFGEEQVRIYTAKLNDCLHDLANDNGLWKEIAIDESVVRVKNCHRHILFAKVTASNTVTVIAILHERMDIVNRLKDRMA